MFGDPVAYYIDNENVLVINDSIRDLIPYKTGKNYITRITPGCKTSFSNSGVLTLAPGVVELRDLFDMEIARKNDLLMLLNKFFVHNNHSYVLYYGKYTPRSGLDFNYCYYTRGDISNKFRITKNAELTPGIVSPPGVYYADDWNHENANNFKYGQPFYGFAKNP